MLEKPSDQAPHVLIVDDDTRIRDLLGNYLLRNGFRVSTAATAAEARARMRALAFDVLVLDIMMPGEDGLSLTKSLREIRADVPILLLSALGEASDRITGLAAGADDYMAKPFEPEELLLRLRALLRRSTTGTGMEKASILELGPYVLDATTGELRKHDRLVRLTGRERELLRLLARTPGEPVPRERLLAPGAGNSPRSVDVEINRLRRKIEPDPAKPTLVRTVRGRGYMLAARERAAPCTPHRREA